MNKKLVLLSACLLLGAGAAHAQKRVTGRVLDNDGLPVIGATVRVDGTKLVTITDDQGNFTFSNVPAKAKHINVSYIGMEPQRVSVSGNIKVVLKQNDIVTDEAVVVGYGTAKKLGTLVGSVAKVGSDKIENKTVANVLDALQGQVAGMQITTQSGDPGLAASGQIDLTVRGTGSFSASSTPLFVLDGAPTSSSILAMMNPNDIASITVLKDASATSIYGSRAANGVVYITTKKGSVHEKALVTIGQSIGWSTLARRVGDPLSAKELMDLRAEFGQLQFNSDKSQYQNYVDAIAGGVNTDWTKYFFEESAPTYNTSFSIRGGSEKTTYYVSASHYKQSGILAPSKYKRMTLRSNIDSKPLSWLGFGVNLNISYDERSSSSASNNPYVNSGTMGAYFMDPTINPYDENGNRLQKYNIPIGTTYDPYYMYSKSKVSHNDIRAVGSAYLQLTPVKGLTLRSQLSMDAYDTRGKGRGYPSYEEFGGSGSASEAFSRSSSFTITNTAEYKFTLKNVHNITLLAGQEGIRNLGDGFSASSTGQANDFALTLGNGLESPLPSSSYSKSVYLSFFGRVDYNFDSKYFANFTVRNDASSRFGRNHKSAMFYSGGLMWDLKREAFLDNAYWIDALQLRANVGSTGNSSINDFAHLRMVGNSQYGLNYGYTFMNFGAEDLMWEKQIQTSVGFDITMFKQLTLGVNFYNRVSKDLLMDVPAGYFTGVSSNPKNAGQMTNKGIELTFSWDAIKTKEFLLNLHGNYTYNKNTVDKLFDNRDHWINSGSSTYYAVGKPFTFYAPIYAGVDRKDGKPMWYKKGHNGDVQHDYNPETMTKTFVNSELEQDTGLPIEAPHFGGFGITVAWKGITLSGDFTYALGKYTLNNDKYFSVNPTQNMYSWNQDKSVLGMWRKPGDVTDIPGWGNDMQFDTHLIENSSYMRLKNLQISYDLPKAWMDATGFFKNIRITASARNLFTVTKYSGADPEPVRNIQMNAYPNTRDYTIGAEVTF